MIKLMDILNEVMSKPAVQKVMQFRNPKFIEAEYILTRVKPPRKEKAKFRVKLKCSSLTLNYRATNKR